MSDWKTCACGARIRFGISPAGKQIPLRPVKTAYAIERVTPEGVPVMRAIEQSEVYISHFVDCPKRDEFRRAR